MKLITLTLSALISFSAFGVSEKLSFHSPEMETKIVRMKPIQTNLIRLYQKMPSERRMIAGFRETKIREVSKTSYLDDLREKLKSTNGKLRL